MSHLEYSFFISSHPVYLDIPEFKLLKFNDYYIGSFSSKFKVGIENTLQLSFEEPFYRKEIRVVQRNLALIEDNIFKIKGSDMNTQAIYYIHNAQANKFIVFNDLYLARLLLESQKMEIEYNVSSYLYNLCFFTHINRLYAGEEITLYKHKDKIVFKKNRITDILSTKPDNNYTFEDSQEIFYQAMDNAVTGAINNEQINISLSGGIDSATIAYFIKKAGKKLNAYTISTDWGSEFEEAKETANFLDINLVQIHLSKEEIIAEIPHLIRYYGFINPEKIEIALIAFCLYKKLCELSKKNRVFFTGYGSDLLNAGIFCPFSNYRELESQILLGLKDAQLSNEFSNLFAFHFQVDVVHPFWESESIITALKIPPSYKVIDNQDKYFFRKCMGTFLPKNIAWRKKKGAHHGTGLSEYLGKELKTKSVSYQDTILDIHKNIFYHGRL